MSEWNERIERAKRHMLSARKRGQSFFDAWITSLDALADDVPEAPKPRRMKANPNTARLPDGGYHLGEHDESHYGTCREQGCVPVDTPKTCRHERLDEDGVCRACGLPPQQPAPAPQGPVQVGDYVAVDNWRSTDSRVIEIRHGLAWLEWSAAGKRVESGLVDEEKCHTRARPPLEDGDVWHHKDTPNVLHTSLHGFTRDWIQEMHQRGKIIRVRCSTTVNVP